MGNFVSAVVSALFVSMFVVVAMISSNLHEPLFMSKSHVLESLKCGQCIMSHKWVVKPVFGSHNGKGVDMESDNWTMQICQDKLGVPCMRQPFHKGPFEGRAVRAGSKWQQTVLWRVPCEDCDKPDIVHVQLPFESALHACVEHAFPDSPFVAVDFRTNGSDLCVLEVNGAFGFTLQWIENESMFGLWMLQWVAERFFAGLRHPERFAQRFHDLVKVALHKWNTRKVASRVWF